MIRLFAMILMAPFWVHFLLAGGVAAFGQYSYDASSKGLAEKMRLAQSAPPPEMAITAFTSDAPRSFPVEVNLRAQVAIEHNVELVKTRNGKSVGERSMYILVAPDAAGDAKLAYGAVILHPSEVDMFADWTAQKVGEGGSLGNLGPILAFDGLRDYPSDTGRIMDALADQGFIAAPNFTYVDPFLKGRAAGLAIKPRDKPFDIAYTYYGAAFFVFLGILKLGLRIRRKGQAPSVTTPIAPAAAVPMAEPQAIEAPAATALANNDFIGALARKAASTDAAKPGQPASAIAQNSKGVMLGGTMRKVAGFGGALALYLVFASFGGSFNIPSVQSLMGTFGLKSEMTEIIMTEAAPISAAETVPLAAPQAQAAPVPQAQTQAVAVPQAQTQAAAVSVAPREAVAAVVPAAKPAPMAVNQGFIRVKAANWIAVVKAQFAQWRTAPPVWLWASLLAAIILMPVLFILRKLPALGRKGAAKSSSVDPFERLLQRRLAEKGRAEKAVMGGMGLLRA